MIKLLGKIPSKIYVACSGGPDSMAALTFLNNRRRDVTAAYFNHGTSHGAHALDFVKRYCNENEIPLVVGHVTRLKDPSESEEEYWRNERYKFFDSLDAPVVTAHHLDDVEEWWVFSSLHGECKLIPYRKGTVIRPFLLTSKKELLSWLRSRDLPYVTDPSNVETVHMRNLIRHAIMPHCKKVNPGLSKVLKKKLQSAGLEKSIHAHGNIRL